MLQWACARIGAILVTLNPAYRVHELIATLSLAQVNHLFLVPRIRSSAYLQILSSALPSLSSSSAGTINVSELPDLRNVVVVDDVGGGAAWEKELGLVKSAVDFREILVWREDGTEHQEVKRLEESLSEHEIINLQFTRSVVPYPPNCFADSWISVERLARRKQSPYVFATFLLVDLHSSDLCIQLTHHNLLNNGIQIGRCMRLTSDDVLCVFHLLPPLNPRS